MVRFTDRRSVYSALARGSLPTALDGADWGGFSQADGQGASRTFQEQHLCQTLVFLQTERARPKDGGALSREAQKEVRTLPPRPQAPAAQWEPSLGSRARPWPVPRFPQDQRLTRGFYSAGLRVTAPRGPHSSLWSGRHWGRNLSSRTPSGAHTHGSPVSHCHLASWAWSSSRAWA